MGKKILLADDSLTIQKVVELTLAGTDYELTCVSNGQKALDALAVSRPDLILADVVMPGKNGYEVCEAVKGNPETAGIPIILLSGTFEPFDRARADRIGSDLVVSKPFDAQQLLGRIESLLGRAAGPEPSFSRPDEAPFATSALDDTLPLQGQSGAAEGEGPFGRDEGSPRATAPLAAYESTPPAAAPEESLRFAAAPAFEEAPAVPEPKRHPVEDASSLSRATEELSLESGYPLAQEAPPPAPAAAEALAEPELRLVEDESASAPRDADLSAHREPRPFEAASEPPPAPEATAESQRHPVEGAPSPEPPAIDDSANSLWLPAEEALVFAPPQAETFRGETPIEEISARDAETLFDLPYEPPEFPAAAPAVLELTDEQIDRIAARVVEKLSDRVVREIAWDVVPDVAEMAVRRRIKELEGGAE